MEGSRNKLYAQALGYGIIAGMRSMTAPALYSHGAAQNTTNGLPGTPYAPLGAPTTATALALLAVGEMIVDKLPVTPARTEPPSVAFRVLSGALVGGALFASNDEDHLEGALVGGLAALAGTFGAYTLRKAISDQNVVPDPVLGMAEDALAVSVGLKALQSG